MLKQQCNEEKEVRLGRHVSERTPLLCSLPLNNDSLNQKGISLNVLPKCLSLGILQYIEQKELATMGLHPIGKRLLLQCCSQEEYDSLIIQVFAEATLGYLQLNQLPSYRFTQEFKFFMGLCAAILVAYLGFPLAVDFFLSISPMHDIGLGELILRLFLIVLTPSAAAGLAALGTSWGLDSISQCVTSHRERVHFRDLLPVLVQEHQKGLVWILKYMNADGKTFQQVNRELTELFAQQQQKKTQIGFFRSGSELETRLTVAAEESPESFDEVKQAIP